jgi:hypothetical protein
MISYTVFERTLFALGEDEVLRETEVLVSRLYLSLSTSCFMDCCLVARQEHPAPR